MEIGNHLIGHQLQSVASTWDDNDTRLYAIAVGAGSADPLQELHFTTQNSLDVTQRVLPTFGVIQGCQVGIGGPLTELPDLDLSRMLHGHQEIELHQDLPVAASVVTSGEITAVWDKGKATVMETETAITDAETGVRYVTSRQSLFFQGYGGWGGERGPRAANAVPDAKPDLTLTFQTRADQALLYRLTGDWNPLHSDPKYAQAAGFPRPILHGLCTYGIVGRLLLNELGGGETSSLRSFGGRFSAPAYPGDDLTVNVWSTGKEHTFVVTNQNDEVLLSNGSFATN
ncbi:MaoC/PaaZ C-terminal domain-containing protein [Rhodococcus sp. T2V]|uniref:MaoC/PaaZ C-terminal domain-containing protein n=1 Tax=Rhodococcus sp. T2V TaxID=3034164 RepID=UPI0023E0E08E|nr:MaoC/PaaZ C-terminal domain-containing protein [Rhodococcus sp. T2V]MDF3311147.1 MaoC/PaaZ C-terminal domain-containing protein [Rhodococcus sp. T2V]